MNHNKIKFTFMDKTNYDTILPQLYDILYTNMSVIAPTGNSYDEDMQSWMPCIKDAIEKPQRQIILIYAGSELVGYFMYYVNNGTFIMEEIQFKPQFQSKGLFQKLYQYLITIVPSDTEYVEAYASKKNLKSQAILAYLGLQIIGENKNGLSYHYKGLYNLLAAHFTTNIPEKAVEIIEYVKHIPQVKGCTLYGSYSTGKADKLSDVDVNIDVSGTDNGLFMLDLPGILSRKFNVLWCDFAPSLASEQYVVSVAVDEKNPFCIIDFKCIAMPHIENVQKSDLSNDILTHMLKLWVANCKHYLRGAECSADIQKMGRKIIRTTSEQMTNEQIMAEVLYRIENNCPPELTVYVSSCRKAWDER